MEILIIVLPLILIGLLAVFLINNAKKQARNDGKEEETGENHLAEGIALGVCFGTAVGIGLGVENIAIGTSVGLLIGMLVGMKDAE